MRQSQWCGCLQFDGPNELPHLQLRSPILGRHQSIVLRVKDVLTIVAIGTILKVALLDDCEVWV